MLTNRIHVYLCLYEQGGGVEGSIHWVVCTACIRGRELVGGGGQRKSPLPF